MTMASHRPPQGWGRGSMARTRPETLEWTYTPPSSGLAITWPTVTLSPGFTTGTAPPPVHMVRGMATCLGDSSRGMMGLRRVLSL